jgi:hypothetical protein
MENFKQTVKSEDSEGLENLKWLIQEKAGLPTGIEGLGRA